MAKRYELNDQQWARIAEMLPGKKSDPGRTGKDNRLFINGVLWGLRSGAQWDELPERYGKWKSVHKRFTRWAKSGVWERVFAALIDDPRNEYVMPMSPSSGPTSRPPPARARPKRGSGRGSGAFPRWTDDQDPSARRCTRAAAALPAHGRRGA